VVQTQKRIHQRFLTDALRICGVITFRVLSEKVLPPHRVLCCETEVGLKSIVRQIEPELHVDAHHHVATQRTLHHVPTSPFRQHHAHLVGRPHRALDPPIGNFLPCLLRSMTTMEV
jgi:hypothetical protein